MEVCILSIKQAIGVVAVGLWTVDIVLGALKVLLPVYLSSVGVSLSNIAFLFFLFKLSEIFAPLGQGLTINRVGYRRSYIFGLGLHSFISILYFIKPSLALIYLERLVRGLISMRLSTSLYVKHFSAKERQGFHINMILGLADVAKGVGMLSGGLLIAYVGFQYSLLGLSLLTATATWIAVLYLPELKEEFHVPMLRAWRLVDLRIKMLGVARAFLLAAWDSWGVVILPVYLARVFGLSPPLVGVIMMGEHVFHGVCVTILSRNVQTGRDPRTVLFVFALFLVPVTMAMAFSVSLSTFLLLVLVYQLLNGASVVNYNRLHLEFASQEKTSLDIAIYKTISNSFNPIAVFVSGVVADTLGFSWAFYFSSFLLILSALTCLMLPVASTLTASEPYSRKSVTL